MFIRISISEDFNSSHDFYVTLASKTFVTENIFQPCECPQNVYHLAMAQKQMNTAKSNLVACEAFKQVLTRHCDSIADTVVIIILLNVRK